MLEILPGKNKGISDIVRFDDVCSPLGALYACLRDESLEYTVYYLGIGVRVWQYAISMLREDLSICLFSEL